MVSLSFLFSANGQNMRERFFRAIDDGDSKTIEKLMNKMECFDDGRSHFSAPTYLHYAVEKGQADIIRTMFANKRHGHKINPDELAHYDCEGLPRDVTPLLLAISKSDIECIKALIDNGADINYNYQDSFSPFGYAKHLDNLDIVKYFREKKRIVKLSNHDIQIFSTNSRSMKEIYDFYDMPTRKNEIISSLIKPYRPNNTRGGYLSIKSNNPKIREYRSFQCERERQILRHVSTQIYFMLENKNVKNLKEIQSLHLQCNGSSNLFVVANDFSVTEKFEKYITENKFSKILTSVYNPRTSEEKERSGRYAAKLKNRIIRKKIIIGDDKNDVSKAEAIRKILCSKNIAYLNMDYNNTFSELNTAIDDDKHSLKYILENKEDNIYFIVIKNCRDEKRHSEEFLCDIVEKAKEIFGVENIYSCIAGKKRPCIGCSGRMRDVSISNYSRYPGLFFKNTITYQTSNVSSSTTELLNGDIYVSECKNKDKTTSGFDSGSDSPRDSEEESEENTRGF